MGIKRRIKQHGAEASFWNELLNTYTNTVGTYGDLELVDPTVYQGSRAYAPLSYSKRNDPDNFGRGKTRRPKQYKAVKKGRYELGDDPAPFVNGGKYGFATEADLVHAELTSKYGGLRYAGMTGRDNRYLASGSNIGVSGRDKYKMAAGEGQGQSASDYLTSFNNKLEYINDPTLLERSVKISSRDLYRKKDSLANYHGLNAEADALIDKLVGPKGNKKGRRRFNLSLRKRDLIRLQPQLDSISNLINESVMDRYNNSVDEFNSKFYVDTNDPEAVREEQLRRLSFKVKYHEKMLKRNVDNYEDRMKSKAKLKMALAIGAMLVAGPMMAGWATVPVAAVPATATAAGTAAVAGGWAGIAATSMGLSGAAAGAVATGLATASFTSLASVATGSSLEDAIKNGLKAGVMGGVTSYAWNVPAVKTFRTNLVSEFGESAVGKAFNNVQNEVNNIKNSVGGTIDSAWGTFVDALPEVVVDTGTAISNFLGLSDHGTMMMSPSELGGGYSPLPTADQAMAGDWSTPAESYVTGIQNAGLPVTDNLASLYPDGSPVALPSGGVLGTYGADYVKGIQDAGLPVVDTLAAEYEAYDEAFGPDDKPTKDDPPKLPQGTAARSPVPQLPPIQQAPASNVRFEPPTQRPLQQGMLTPTPIVTPDTLVAAQVAAPPERKYYGMFAQNLDLGERNETIKKSRTA